MQRRFYLALIATSLIVSPCLQARPYPGFTGLVATADNAGTAGTNPAGIIRFEERSGKIELMAFSSESTFEGTIGDGTPFSSSDSGSLVVPSAYFIQPINDKFSFGFTILGMGFSSDLGDWQGRYILESYSSVTISAFPSLAYRINDKLSVAGSLQMSYASFDQERSVANIFDPGVPDGRSEIETDGTDIGFGLSLLYQASDNTRWGVNYLSELEPTLDGKIEFTGLGPNTEQALESAGVIGSKVEVISKTPQSLAAGVYHEFSNRHAVTVDVMWVDFSEFQLSEYYLDGDSLVTQESSYEDILAISASYSWPISERWMLGLGGAYVSEMVKDKDRTITLRLDDIWTLGAGAEWQWTDTRQLEFGFSYIRMGDAPVSTPALPVFGAISGRYTERDVFQFDIAVKFGAL